VARGVFGVPVVVGVGRCRAWAFGALCTPLAALLDRRLVWYGSAPLSACQSWALMGGRCVGLCYFGVGVDLVEFLA
jgi:hypothetical protein